MVLGQVDRALLDLALAETNLTTADLSHPFHIHERVSRHRAAVLTSARQIHSDRGHGRPHHRPQREPGHRATAGVSASPGEVTRGREGRRYPARLRRRASPALSPVPVQIGNHTTTRFRSLPRSADANAAVRLARLLFLAVSAGFSARSYSRAPCWRGPSCRPIDQIVRRARMIRSLALAERLPHPGTQDEMARLVETLNDMLARIEQSFEAQRRFTADASHELRSPLSRLRAELEVTLRRPRERAKYEEVLRSCLSEVERLSHLTGELLMLARLDAGGPPEAPVPVDLISILHEAVKRLSHEALRRNVTLAMDVPPEVTVKHRLPRHWSHVVTNVMDNAVKFSPVGSEVRVSVAIERGAAVVVVSDARSRDPRRGVPRIFERFYRGRVARQMESTRRRSRTGHLPGARRGQGGGKSPWTAPPAVGRPCRDPTAAGRPDLAGFASGLQIASIRYRPAPWTSIA